MTEHQGDNAGVPSLSFVCSQWFFSVTMSESIRARLIFTKLMRLIYIKSEGQFFFIIEKYNCRRTQSVLNATQHTLAQYSKYNQDAGLLIRNENQNCWDIKLSSPLPSTCSPYRHMGSKRRSFLGKMKSNQYWVAAWFECLKTLT